MEQISKRFLNWASILEDTTREQVGITSQMPFVYPHIALMPDAHWGMGCAVGAVLPTLGAIMPAAVGVDIGCGMIAVRSQFTAKDFGDRSLKDLRELIESRIPLSAGNYNASMWDGKSEDRIELLEKRAKGYGFDPDQYDPNWRLQLGSLGSGNHFIEVSLDEEDRVWFFLHSGSRGIGNRIARHHIKVAQKQAERYYIDLPNKDLAYLIEGDDNFWAYIREMTWAQHFALLNREEMMDRLIYSFEEWMGVDEVYDTPEGQDVVLHKVKRETEVNCHHNYTEQETHFGKKVWLSRKGAIDASLGRLGLIPGSMGTRSYVVKGKGNPLALNSAPHGAGREYGRRHAERTFTKEQLDKAMDGIEWSGSEKFLDEIPMAYKDIDTVMEDAKNLVEVVHTLRQIVNVKGD